MKWKDGKRKKKDKLRKKDKTERTRKGRAGRGDYCKHLSAAGTEEVYTGRLSGNIIIE